MFAYMKQYLEIITFSIGAITKFSKNFQSSRYFLDSLVVKKVYADFKINNI